MCRKALTSDFLSKRGFLGAITPPPPLFMANPSHDVNAYAKHIALHVYQYPVLVTWGGASNLELS